MKTFKMIGLLLMVVAVPAWGAATRTIDADSITSSDKSKTYSLPAATDTLIGRSSTDTLSNKSISGASNTISNVNLASQVTGNLPVSNLNSGTSASATTFWRGDATWATPASGGTTSELLFTNGNGYGSTNTVIRKYSTKVTDTGTAFSHNFAGNMGTNGLEVTINEAGAYTMCEGDLRSTNAAIVGFSKNSNQLTTNILSPITAAHFVAASQGVIGQAGAICATRSLVMNDVIRPHQNGGQDDTTVVSFFSIMRVR